MWEGREEEGKEKEGGEEGRGKDVFMRENEGKHIWLESCQKHTKFYNF